MFPTRVILLCALALFCFSSALAQRPGPQFWRTGDCEPFEPRTRLEMMDRVQGEVIIDPTPGAGTQVTFSVPVTA